MDERIKELVEQAGLGFFYQNNWLYAEELERFVGLIHAEVLTDNLNNLANLRSVVDAQGRDGCWNYGQYGLGLFNGLELALSIFERREPKFRSKEDLVERDYRLVATNEEGRIRWVVDDWPMHCSLYMKRPEKIYPATESSPSGCEVDAYEYVTGGNRGQKD